MLRFVCRCSSRLALSALGLLLLAGCSGSGKQVLGTPPSGEPVTVAAAQAVANKQPVTVHGKMVEKCPVAGCWFMLKDDTGTIKVDTKSAGFVVLNVPVGTDVTVSGKSAANGSERMVEASGVRY
jgi:uncharacterized protein YdeI (BOF family)